MLAWSQMELGTLAWASLWVAGGSLSASSTHTKKKNGTKSKLHPREGTCWGYHRARIVPTLLLRKYVAESHIRIVLHDALLERLELSVLVPICKDRHKAKICKSWQLIGPPKTNCLFSMDECDVSFSSLDKRTWRACSFWFKLYRKFQE